MTMSEDAAFRELQIKDIALELHDGPHATPKPAESGPIFLGIKNITDDGRLDLSAIRHIDEVDYPRWTRRVTPQPDDVVFTYEATLHRYALIPHGFRGCLGRRLALIRPRRDVVDPKFLHIALLGPEWRQTVEDRVIAGATVDRVPLLEFPDFPIKLPPLKHQLRIAAVLTAFDELITINERRIELLETLASSLYREWFVQLRFPGHRETDFADSKLGRLPNGWTVRNLSEITRHLSRGVAPHYQEDGPWVVVNQRCIRDGRVSLASARRQAREASEAKRVRFGDILINSTGVGTLGRVAMFLLGLDRVTVDTHVTIVRPRSSDEQPWLGLTLRARQNEFEAMGTGSTGQTELGRKTIGELRLAVPDARTLTAFSEMLWPMLNEVTRLSQHNDHVAATRDLLLPRLVTGRLDISDVDLGDLLPTEAA